MLCVEQIDSAGGIRSCAMKLQINLGYESFSRLLHTPVALVSLASVAMALLAGCATGSTKSESMLDPQADFGAYRTFETETRVNVPGQPTSLVDANIQAAIATEMRRKGYVEATTGSTADLLVEYEAASAETVKSSPFRIGIGVGSYGSGGGGSVSTSTSGVKNVIEGSLVIHVIDSARNAEVWRSRVSRELGKGNIKPEVIQSAIAEVFSDFPARSDAP
jgi:hypothetical protein